MLLAASLAKKKGAHIIILFFEKKSGEDN